MEEIRIYDMEEVKKESTEAATKTPFYETEFSGGAVWVLKPGQTLKKHCHTTSDDIWVILEGEGVFYPEPDKEVPFKKGQVIVSPKGMCHGATNTGTKDVVLVGIIAPFPSDFVPVED